MFAWKHPRNYTLRCRSKVYSCSSKPLSATALDTSGSSFISQKITKGASWFRPEGLITSSLLISNDFCSEGGKFHATSTENWWMCRIGCECGEKNGKPCYVFKEKPDMSPEYLFFSSLSTFFNRAACCDPVYLHVYGVHRWKASSFILPRPWRSNLGERVSVS